MNRSKPLTYLLSLFIALGLQSCSSDNKDEPTANSLNGTWLLTHYSYKYHYFENGVWWDAAKEEVVTEFNLTGYDGASIGKWWDHITFTNNVMDIGLIQHNLPTQPLASDYDLNSIEGLTDYQEAVDKWETALESNGTRPGLSFAGDEIDSWLCPYSLKGNKLFIGSLYNGDIKFTDTGSFTLIYKNSTFNNDGEYKQYIYTFKKNS
ncbi:MAG: hypothetical protein NC210_08340 [[Clostridium] fimetarium]|nr:hypothetical protein [Alistipes timonensis]MCM1406414.1 hypothetical protein [[Clostridium] fimetarium]